MHFVELVCLNVTYCFIEPLVFFVNGVKKTVEYFVNLDLESTITPINIEEFDKLLTLANYPRTKAEFLIQGFMHSFDIGYTGSRNRISTSDNIPFSIGDEFEMWSKVMKEVKLGQYTGPFDNVPFEHFIQSPIGLVPKDGGKKTRLIFHLSFDFGEKEEDKSLNYHTLDDICSVKYKDLNYAVKLSLDIKKELGNDIFQGLYYGKTDLSSAFRILPMALKCFCLLVMKAEDLITQKWWFFIDKCLPFLSSRSCALFQQFSDALQFLTKFLAKRRCSVSNYLDDFLFIATTLQMCNHLLSTFLHLCEKINCPVSDEKTVWGTQLIVFLGILLDGKNFVLMLPTEKFDKAKRMLQWFLSKRTTTSDRNFELFD